MVAQESDFMIQELQCIDPFRTFSDGRKSGAKWVDGAKWVEMVRNGSISGIQNFSNEKQSIFTNIIYFLVLFIYSEGFEKLTLSIAKKILTFRVPVSFLSTRLFKR